MKYYFIVELTTASSHCMALLNYEATIELTVVVCPDLKLHSIEIRPEVVDCPYQNQHISPGSAILPFDRTLLAWANKSCSMTIC